MKSLKIFSLVFHFNFQPVHILNTLKVKIEKKGGFFMKHEIINNGKPNLKNMTKAEFNVFCKSVLDIIIEDKKDKEKSPAEENGDSYIKTHILSWTN